MNLTASDVIAILGAFFAGVAAVITALNNAKAGKVIQQNQDQFGKLDEIHKDVNGKVAEVVAARVKEQVDAAVALAVAKVLAERK